LIVDAISTNLSAMRTDQTQGVVCMCALLAVAGCGGGGAAEPPLDDGTSGGEDPITCSVPNSPAMEDYIAGVRLLRAGDASALNPLERACEADNACACSAAGASLESGQVVTRDVDRGIALLQRGCQGADPYGCVWLGSAIFENRPDDLNQAGDAFAAACDDDIASACQALGRFRVSGMAGSEDPREGVRLYQSACENGDVFGCYYLGQAAAAGLGMDEPDPARARELLGWACEQAQLPHACTSLAELDTERRGDLLRSACDAGDPVACVAIEPEAPPSDGTAAEALALPTADAQARVITNTEGANTSVTLGGDVDLSTLGLPPTCVGFVGRQPSQILQIPEAVDTLGIVASSDADSVIAVRDGAGRWHCADDQPGGAYHARVTLTPPPPGVLAIWGGTLRSGEVPGAIDFQALGVEPLNPSYATPPGPVAVTIPASARTRFYRLRVMSRPDIAGVVRLDGEVRWSFGHDGATMVSDERLGCALTAGAHTLEVEVTERTRTAHGIDGGPLLDVELHGFTATGGEISDASRLFRIQWSPPEAPQTRTTTFRLTRAQAADRSQCAAAAAPAP